MNRRPSENIKRGYSDEEIAHIYQLGRLFLEIGNIRKAEIIMVGLLEVIPEYVPAWLALSFIYTQVKNYDAVSNAAREALRLEPESVEAMLFLAIATLNTNDFNAAGTYLGEVGDLVEKGEVSDARIVRLYKMQLARFEGRTK
jgi:tetratricopeptide (TPR) repeat protein